MAAVAHRCPSCSAPLPAAAPGSAVTCEHCGVQSRLPGQEDPDDAAAVVIDASGSTGRGGCGALLLIFGIPFGLVALLVCAFSVLPGLIGAGTAGIFVAEDARREAEEAQQEALERVREAQEEAEERAREEAEERGISRSQLAGFEDGGWTNFAERPPGVDLAAMDPVAVLPWAREVARSWSPDAELYRVDVDHVPQSGLLDIVHDDEASMDLRFFSPRRVQAAEALREVSEESVVIGMRMRIEEGGISVGPSGGPHTRAEFRPLTEALCSLPEVMQTAAAAERARTRPFYSLGLRVRTPYAGLPSWVWERDNMGGYVFPDTCEAWSLGLARRRAR